MIAGIVSALAHMFVNASVNQQRTGGAGSGRGYYNWVITTFTCLLPALFFVFLLASIPAAVRGEQGAWTYFLISLGGFSLLTFLIATQIIRREVAWTPQGVRFRWLTGEAQLAWQDIEKVEIRPHSRSHARVTFRDGRTFDFGAQFTGCNAFLRELTQRGIPFYRWGTTKPLD